MVHYKEQYKGKIKILFNHKLILHKLKPQNKMATETSLSLVSSDGTPFVLDVDKVIYATDDSNSKSILTYETGQGTNLNVTLSVSTATLAGYATQALFIEATIPQDGSSNVNVCYNNSRVIEISDWNGHSKVLYNSNLPEVADVKVLNASPSTVNTNCTTTIALTNNTTSTTFYANPSYFENITEITSATSANKSLNSAVLAAAGTAWIPTETFNFAGGTHSHIATGIVDTTKLVSGAVTAAGTSADPTVQLIVAGGTSSVVAEMEFNSKVVSITATPDDAGAGYAPGDTVNPDGGTGTEAVFTVTSTKVITVDVVGVGSGGTPGAATITGTTGTGTKFQCAVTIDGGGSISAVGAITLAGNYTVNPTDITVEPVTGGSLSGATVILKMGVKTLSLTTAGVYTVNPTSIAVSETTAVTGTGTGMLCTFVMGVNAIISITNAGSYTVNPTLTNNAVTNGATGATVTIVMGINTFSITDGGAYTVAPSNPVSSTGASASGIGATFTATFSNSVTKILFNDKSSAAPYPLLVNETPVEVAALINA